mgnify:CR=1 FL=1
MSSGPVDGSSSALSLWLDATFIVILEPDGGRQPCLVTTGFYRRWRQPRLVVLNLGLRSRHYYIHYLEVLADGSRAFAILGQSNSLPSDDRLE